MESPRRTLPVVFGSERWSVRLSSRTTSPRFIGSMIFPAVSSSSRSGVSVGSNDIVLPNSIGPCLWLPGAICSAPFSGVVSSMAVQIVTARGVGLGGLSWW